MGVTYTRAITENAIDSATTQLPSRTKFWPVGTGKDILHLTWQTKRTILTKLKQESVFVSTMKKEKLHN